jgi:hypothetical protein
MESLVTVLLFVVGALGWVAYHHHENYPKIYPWLVAVLALANMGLSSWNWVLPRSTPSRADQATTAFSLRSHCLGAQAGEQAPGLRR